MFIRESTWAYLFVRYDKIISKYVIFDEIYVADNTKGYCAVSKSWKSIVAVAFKHFGSQIPYNRDFLYHDFNDGKGNLQYMAFARSPIFS